MRYIVVIFVICMCITSCEFDSYPLKGGYAITIDGDTIPFYGGTLTIGSKYSRDIRDVKIEKQN